MELEEEIARLRQEVARLETRVAELDHLAHSDSLVDLPNRRGLDRALEAAIAANERHGVGAALLYVDVDNLKMINDGFGHGAGDAALIHVARRLVEGTRPGDTVARLGGDEFVVLLTHVDAEDACASAQRLVDEIAGDGLIHEGQPVPLSVAIGIAPIEKGDRPNEALARADAAMYAKKRAA
ncbi:GGDEF domain-containing protein [Sphingomicrobium nitratireducens]|uniref:GGDEF domain-containing protein n=1 Tax=Sphingomicrobium nitratireducens TaxID=2964666 RepID=UPI00223EF7CB